VLGGRIEVPCRAAIQIIQARRAVLNLGKGGSDQDSADDRLKQKKTVPAHRLLPGSSGWTRTNNPAVNSRMLCH
jgi:hypothetical protein